jgi:hypothetical protein
MTWEQNQEWKEWGINYFRKTFKTKKSVAEHQMEWFSLQYGLKFSDLPSFGPYNTEE